MTKHRCTIEPFGVPIDFTLRDIVDVGEFASEGPRLGELEDWVGEGGVTLRAIAIEAYLTDEDRVLLRDECFWAEGGGSPGHQKLIATAWLYLRRRGKVNACRRGASGCLYAGGWGDACVPGENYFVECGTLGGNKPYDAMTAGQALLLIPYDHWRDANGVRWRLGYELRPARPMIDPNEKVRNEEIAAKRRTWNIWRPPTSNGTDGFISRVGPKRSPPSNGTEGST